MDELVQAALRDFLTPPRPGRLTSRESQLLAEAWTGTLRVAPGIENAVEDIHYYRWGSSGKRILLVHGWGGRASQYFSFIPQLVDAGYEVVAYDAPAHGASGGLLASGPAFANAALRVVETTGPIHGAVAHSLGCPATVIAMRKGLALRRAVFLAPLAFIFPLLENFARERGLPDVARERLSSLFLAKYPPDILSVPIMARSMTAGLLVFHDQADTDVPFAHSEAITAAWSEARLNPLANAGHWRLLRMKEVLEATIAFLA
jgi:pimeloyl-ACP methyl ester carboxylesterase